MLRLLLVFVLGVLAGIAIRHFVLTINGPDCVVAAPAVPTRPEPTPPPPAAPPVPAASPLPAPSAPAPAGQLLLPVAGVGIDQLVDTYTQSRGEGREHDAIDIMAPAGTPVMAAVDGPVAKLFTSERGGLTVYQFDPDGRYVYYYAHLQGYAPGLAEGQALSRGQVLGYVGSTGNADPAAPHLHFGVARLGPEKSWWKATPLNPYPLLTGATRLE